MAKTTNPVKDSMADMLSAFVAEAPEKQTRTTAARADFNADPEVLARVSAALVSTGAITSATGYGSEKEARKMAKTFRNYAEVAVTGIEGKTISFRLVQRADKWHWKIQLATKRIAKEKEDTATEAPAVS